MILGWHDVGVPYRYLLSGFWYVLVVMMPEVEIVIERSRKFAVLASLFVYHNKRF